MLRKEKNRIFRERAENSAERWERVKVKRESQKSSDEDFPISLFSHNFHDKRRIPIFTEFSSIFPLSMIEFAQSKRQRVEISTKLDLKAKFSQLSLVRDNLYTIFYIVKIFTQFSTSSTWKSDDNPSLHHHTTEAHFNQLNREIFY